MGGIVRKAVGKAIAILLLTSIMIIPSVKISHAKEKIQKKLKDYSNIISIAHTFFFKNEKNEEISVYFSTIEAEKENREKVFDITLYLYKAIINEGYKEIPADYPVPPKNIIFVEVIQQQPEGIVIIITKNGESIWKLFVTSLSDDIVDEIILKISGVEI